MDNNKRDDILWQMAKRRAGFKWSLASYIFVNAFLIGIWYFTSGNLDHFWPIWPMLGWGLGLAFQYFGAYHGDRMFTAEEEYEKLKKQTITTINHTTMKKIILLLITVCSLQLTAFSQSEMYQKKMGETLMLLDSAKSVQDMQEVAAQFERIGDMEKTQWLPFYYAALTQVNLGWRLKPEEKDKNLDKANAILKKAEAIEKNAELYVVEYMIALQQMTVDPATRWMNAKPVMDAALANAKKADPNNPRIYYMEANNVFNTPAAFGGGKEKAKPIFEKSVELYKTVKPASPLHPKWGQKDAEAMLAKCSS